MGVSKEGIAKGASPVTTLKVNGIPVLCEKIPFFSTISFGVWISAGSRDEPADKAGLFHFIEHLVFKGSDRRDQRAVAIEIDALGGHIEAFTSREITCYAGKVVKNRIGEAFDLVADIMLHSTFLEDEIERERQVILEEIRMAEDNPTDFIQERMYPALWGSHPLGRQITGDPSTVANITRDDLLAARDKFYCPPEIVITACGDIEPEEIFDLVERHFGHLKSGEKKENFIAPDKNSGIEIFEKPIEQTHLLIASPGLAMTDPKRNELAILNTVLGGGVSSRLFQAVREERGLAYSISSFYEQYHDTGFFGVYAACAPNKLIDMTGAIKKEMENIAKNPLTLAEVNRAKAMEKDDIIMSFESPSARVYEMAEEMIYFGAIKNKEQLLAEVDVVTPEKVQALANELFLQNNKTILAVGPVTEEHRKALIV